MHEMSIALNIIRIAEEELRKSEREKITAISLSIGKLSGIVIESLKFALEASGALSRLSGARITIEEIPAKMKCLNCNHEFECDDFYSICPECEAFRHEILSGKELVINSITIQ